MVLQLAQWGAPPGRAVTPGARCGYRQPMWLWRLQRHGLSCWSVLRAITLALRLMLPVAGCNCTGCADYDLKDPLRTPAMRLCSFQHTLQARCSVAATKAQLTGGVYVSDYPPMIPPQMFTGSIRYIAPQFIRLVPHHGLTQPCLTAQRLQCSRVNPGWARMHQWGSFWC